jgi:catechol 2,3-dioxygenase-like lactoylglutathione lyase family enzyme
MAIHLVHGVALGVMVGDVERSIRFYTGALGFEVRARRADEYAEVELAGVRLALSRAESPGWKDVHAFPLSIALEVERLEGAMLVLRDRGVRFAPAIGERDGERIAFFTDPDGTPLYLKERPPGGTS